jgi:acetyltransferase-like isoleucine patch superfamily enzyme
MGDIVGAFTYCGPGLRIHRWPDDNTQLTVGKFCSIAGQLNIFLGGNHRTDWMTTYPFGKVFTDDGELGPFDIQGVQVTAGDVTIGNDVWIGQNVTIMSGVTIGDGAVLAANAHVVKSVGPYVIVGGNPAKEIARRFDDAIIERLLRLQWWNLPIADIKEIAPMLCQDATIGRLDRLIREYRNDDNPSD